MQDPVTISPQTLKKLSVDYEIVNTNCRQQGSYLLVLHAEKDFKISVGKLGEILFEQGYYVYVGSGQNNLDKRVKRHLRKSKKKHWHIDYITPKPMTVVKNYLFRRQDPLENYLAERLKKISQKAVSGFGASDSPKNSSFASTWPFSI